MERNFESTPKNLRKRNVFKRQFGSVSQLLS